MEKEENFCFITGLPAKFHFLDGDNVERYVCEEIRLGAEKLFNQYRFADHELTFQNALDSVICNLLYLAEKDRGMIEGKEHEALPQFKKPVKKSLWNKYFSGKKS